MARFDRQIDVSADLSGHIPDVTGQWVGMNYILCIISVNSSPFNSNNNHIPHFSWSLN